MLCMKFRVKGKQKKLKHSMIFAVIFGIPKNIVHSMKPAIQHGKRRHRTNVNFNLASCKMNVRSCECTAKGICGKLARRERALGGLWHVTSGLSTTN